MKKIILAIAIICLAGCQNRYQATQNEIGQRLDSMRCLSDSLKFIESYPYTYLFQLTETKPGNNFLLGKYEFKQNNDSLGHFNGKFILSSDSSPYNLKVTIGQVHQIISWGIFLRYIKIIKICK
ncbi:MAG: hypothetical protein NTY80_01545 [candidate division SR1 bacterium]|nr:hypothetical protein [candidate division SR1 bacterium]